MSALEHVAAAGRTETRQDALFSFSVSDAVGTEYVPMFNDMVRMAVIQLTIQMLLYFSGDAGERYFTREFLMLLMYIILGVLMYWLVVRKFVKIV